MTPPGFRCESDRSFAQIELHLYNPQHELIEYLKEKNIVPQAYSPLGSTNSPLMKDEVVLELAEKYSVSAADILLGYLREYTLALSSKIRSLMRQSGSRQGCHHPPQVCDASSDCL